ncbi:MAG TPA: RHS repeat-associated core domain-containing protein [Galbitalea sp.]|nr:RHS repeat-associated core domain-containing protein [Galbitalea sp.]
MTSANLAYDSHGDITTLGDETLTYDQSGRHLSTSTTGGGGATVSYLRDASDAVVSMTTTTGGGSPSTVEYSDAGGVQFTFNSDHTVLDEITLSLPGGVTESIQGSSLSAPSVWSYPDLHGDDTVTADSSGARSAAVAIYDPFGDPIDLTTGQIGTLAADTPTLSNTTVAGTSYGWEGSHLKQDQTAGDIATIEMGARQYVPLLGRFLSVDPVAEGNSNDYNYPNNPNNGSDLTGKLSADGAAGWAADGYEIVIRGGRLTSNGREGPDSEVKGPVSTAPGAYHSRQLVTVQRLHGNSGRWTVPNSDSVEVTISFGGIGTDDVNVSRQGAWWSDARTATVSIDAPRSMWFGSTTGNTVWSPQKFYFDADGNNGTSNNTSNSAWVTVTVSQYVEVSWN